jgi:hypothetical protein
VLLCADAAGAAAALAGGQLACPCGQGRLALWGRARQRVIELPGGVWARLRPARARCRACGRTQALLPGWCAPRRAHGIAVIATAAAAALEGTGCRVIAARLGVPAGTVRGWLRRLRARAEPLRCHATRQLARFDPHAWLPGPAGSPLADGLAALAPAVHAARMRLGYGPDLTWPLLGTLGLGHAFMPAPGG